MKAQVRRRLARTIRDQKCRKCRSRSLHTQRIGHGNVIVQCWVCAAVTRPEDYP